MPTLHADVRKGSRLCENVLEPRIRRIVFSISFSRQNWKVQLVFTSTKSRRNFYTQVERQSFHTAWVKTGKAQCEHIFSALPLRADIAQCSRHVCFVPISDIRSRQLKRPLSFAHSPVKLTKSPAVVGPLNRAKGASSPEQSAHHAADQAAGAARTATIMASPTAAAAAVVVAGRLVVGIVTRGGGCRRRDDLGQQRLVFQLVQEAGLGIAARGLPAHDYGAGSV